MNVKSMPTHELDRRLKELLAADVPPADTIREMLAELRRREPPMTDAERNAMWPLYMRIVYPEPILDPATGIMLQPSCHGEDCPGLNECRDEYDYFLDCFPAKTSEPAPKFDGKSCLADDSWPGYPNQCPTCRYYKTVCFPKFEDEKTHRP